jgi:DNA polymerase-3 subunit epsilon
MRQIILDTETTGLETSNGHRIIEIGCVELIDRRPSGNHFHQYINPERESEDGALEVHGISSEFLQDKPLFAEVVADFLEFVSGAELIIHNAPFDIGFLDCELALLQRSDRMSDHVTVLDTLELARDLHPGQRNTPWPAQQPGCPVQTLRGGQQQP